MGKQYKDRIMAAVVDMAADGTADESVFFFPKHVPPISIRAKSREEAEEKLAALDNHQ